MPAALLRIMTCGSVDDGKSTLLGRLLYDLGQVPDDQNRQLAGDSRAHGNAGAGEIDYALLLDGLEAEREQGITIDVAYRYANSAHRRLIIADAPGHAQYTRNMVVAASNADLAIVLIDARQGVLDQTRRHSAILQLMRVRHVVLAVNKMDLVGYDGARFADICAQYEPIVQAARFATMLAIPLCARSGENLSRRSATMPWYTGPILLDYLDGIAIDPPPDAAFRMPVQWVNRPADGFRGYAGTIAAGSVRPGLPVVVSGSGNAGTIARIVTFDGDLDSAGAGTAVTLVLDQALDISRGDVIADAADPVAESDQFSADLIWLADQPLVPGRTALFKIGTRVVPGTCNRIRHRLDIQTGVHEAADTLALNDVARMHFQLAAPVAFAPYADNRDLGGFVMIDRQTLATVGVGMIEHALTRAANLSWQAIDITAERRAAIKFQQPAVLWFTGLSGAGKSTIANLVERRLHALGRHTYLLDGDNVRHGLNRDLGFTEADRVENIRRVGEVAALFADAGLLVLVSFISPYRAERDAVRDKIPAGRFLEVFVDTPIADCRRRDPKGLYAQADAGRLPNFTGVTAPYEPPLAPDLHLQTQQANAEDLAEQVIVELRERGFLGD